MNKHTMEYVAKEFSNADYKISTEGSLLWFTARNYVIELILNKEGKYESVEKRKFNGEIIEEALENTINELTPILESFRKQCEVLQHHTPKIMEEAANERIVHDKRFYNLKVIDDWNLLITHRKTQCLFTYNEDGEYDDADFSQDYVSDEVAKGCFEVETLFWKKYNNLLEKYNKQ